MPRNVRLTMVNIFNTMRPIDYRRAECLEMIENAGKEGSDIVLLPEMADHHRTPEAVQAHEEGKDAVREKLSFTFESPWVREVIRLAKSYKMCVIPCIARRDGDKVYNSAVVFGPDGRFLGKYDKSHLAPGEETKFEWGQSLDPIATPFGKIGIFTCWDVHFPEIPRVYYCKGAELLLWTTMCHSSFDRELYTHILPSYCITTGLPLGASTYAVDDHQKKRSVMNSAIFDSSGQVIAAGNHERNYLVRATIDLDERAGLTPDWGLPNDMTFAALVKKCRRPELYGAISQKQ